MCENRENEGGRKGGRRERMREGGREEGGRGRVWKGNQSHKWCVSFSGQLVC